MLNQKYEILKKIQNYFKFCKDYAMKGTICYILSFIASNSEMKPNIEELGWEFTFNSDICFPKDMTELYLETVESYENKKIETDLDKVSKYVILQDVR
jgi:hypothetical protein